MMDPRRWWRISARIVLLFAVLAGSACCDMKEHRIPNWWMLAAFSCGLALAVLDAPEGRWGPTAVGYVLRVSVCMALLFPLFVLRMIGAGDIKLMAVMVGYMGMKEGLRIIAYGCFAGAVLALVKLLAQKNLRRRLNYLLAYFWRLFHTKEIVPYYRADRDGYGIVLPLAVCLLAGYAWYLFRTV